MSSVREARRFLGAVLREWGTDEYEFTAPQVLSELATNAALHARSAYRVRVHLDEGCLLLEVSDSSPRPPRARRYSPDATTGRGMGLVASLSSAWGTTPNTTGKTVWARVEPDSAMLGELDLEGLDQLQAVSGDSSVGVSRGMARPSSDQRGAANHVTARAS
jgi:anti-sigma regulatory factor (Ser/Thr protein kinase)